MNKFPAGAQRALTAAGSRKTSGYDPEARIGVAISKIGTSNAISLGSYDYALNHIGINKN
jgi:glucokinase